MHEPLSKSAPSRPLTALRRFVGQGTTAAQLERCELCSLPLTAEHQHLIEPSTRRLACACDACALLFDQPGNGRYSRVPRSGRFMPDFVLTDEQWDSLLIPISMAFFFHSTPAGKIVALYPSPAGPMESLLPLEAWQELAAANVLLRAMQPDVEALLVNRLGSGRGFQTHEYYLAPIDACYRLVGLIRAHWRGFSGGNEVWQEIEEFFTRLKHDSRVIHAEPPAALAAGFINTRLPAES